MTYWRDDPDLVQKLEHAAPGPDLERRKAILDALYWRGFTRWRPLIEAVEKTLGEGVFGSSPQNGLQADLRWLRRAGFEIGYSQMRGAKGYYIRRASLPESVRIVLDQIQRELDFEHIDRVGKLPGERRIEGMFELMDFLRDVSKAGQQVREQKR